MIKKIGILTSGGDAPGMNTAVATTIRLAIANHIKPYIIKDGYKGLCSNWIEETNLEFADSIMNQGGTAIGSARYPEFAELKVRKIAVANLKKHDIQALVVIGGDGSYKGALKLTKMGINCVALPGTIDNDIASSDYTIGFDTCLNTIVECIDKVRDTMRSHNRCAVIETMGRECGDLALAAAAATGCEVLAMAEHRLAESEIVAQVTKLAKAKRRSVIVLVTELLYDVNKLAVAIEKGSKYITRANVLGHIQRGGRPSAFDRHLAYTLSLRAVEELLANHGGICIGLVNNQVKALDITKALALKRISKSKEMKELKKLQASYIDHEF